MLIFSTQYVDDQIKTCKIRRLTPRGSQAPEPSVKLSPSSRGPDPASYGAASCYDYLLPDQRSIIARKAKMSPKPGNVKMERPFVQERTESPKELQVAAILAGMNPTKLKMPALE